MLLSAINDILTIDGTLTGTTTPDQSGPGSNTNEGETSYYSKLQDWMLTVRCRLVSYPGHMLCGWGNLPLCRGAVGKFYNTSWQNGLITVQIDYYNYHIDALYFTIVYELHWSTTNLLSAFFLVDLERIWCAESKNHIGFTQSGQVFELWPQVVFLVFVHMYACVKHFRRSWWG